MTRRRRMGVCSTPGCPEYTEHSKCDDCRQAAEQRRGTARQRGYGRRHEQRFRPGVLAKDPTCVCTNTSHAHGTPCGQPSRHADHYPLDRRELVARGMDPDDPAHGRGLCGRCHSSHTAHEQPGGWHQ